MSAMHDDDPPPSEGVWDLFRRDEPEAREIQAAYLRFAGRRPERLSVFRVARWLVVGFGAGLGVAFAATGVPLLGTGLYRTLRGGPHPHEGVPTAHPAARAPAREPPAPSALPLPSAAAAPEPASSGSARPPGPPPHATLGEPAPTDPKWQRAATALKTHDYSAAEAALREVETTGAPGDRDAASLALAQVLLTRGRVVEARARLERLRARASSALVREKAAALLGDVFSFGGRSSAAAPVPE